MFISLLTRDISLSDAFLDLIDNSINSAIKSSNVNILKPDDFFAYIANSKSPKFRVDIVTSEIKVVIKDNCGGISTQAAQDEVFIFGASPDDDRTDDKLSVYGIGLKRAIFKLGNNIEISSDHLQGGFQITLDVPSWAKDKTQPWTFPIAGRPPSEKVGTTIEISNLHDAVKTRLADPTFLTSLEKRISRAYSFFIGRIIVIYLNGKEIETSNIEIAENHAADSFDFDDVNVSLVAGIGVPKGKNYSAEGAGWNVFCNGRAIISFDKSELTGWGVEGLLPTFQPKHRPFLGVAFFTADDPEKLPWTTTKLGVNPDNIVWQRALRRMADVAKQVTRFLDERYSEEGTTITRDEMSDAIGSASYVAPTVSVRPVIFQAPKPTPRSTTSIQYTVNKAQLSLVKAAIGRRSMSNSEVGRYTFDYFVENEIA